MEGCTTDANWLMTERVASICMSSLLTSAHHGTELAKGAPLVLITSRKQLGAVLLCATGSTARLQAPYSH